MKLPRLRTIILVPVVLFALFYATGAVMLATDDREVPTLATSAADYTTVVIFGASGGVTEAVLRYAVEKIKQVKIDSFEFHEVRGQSGIRETRIEVNAEKDSATSLPWRTPRSR